MFKDKNLWLIVIFFSLLGFLLSLFNSLISAYTNGITLPVIFIRVILSTIFMSGLGIGFYSVIKMFIPEIFSLLDENIESLTTNQVNQTSQVNQTNHSKDESKKKSKEAEESNFIKSIDMSYLDDLDNFDYKADLDTSNENIDDDVENIEKFEELENTDHELNSTPSSNLGEATMSISKPKKTPALDNSPEIMANAVRTSIRRDD